MSHVPSSLVGPPPAVAAPAGLRRTSRPRWRGRGHVLCSGRVDVRRHEPQRAPALSASPLCLTHTRAPCAALAAVSQPPVPAATVAHTAPRLHVPRQVRCAAGRAGGGSGVAAAAAATPSPSRLAGLWQKLLLMGSLFFFMAYNNALLDSLKDTLTVTALGGAEQIPFLTVWAVLPCSILFVLGFSALSTRLPRRTLFNATLGLFLGFYAVFTYILFPLRAQLAPTELTNALMAVMPVGLHGGVAVRFYPRPGHSLPLPSDSRLAAHLSHHQVLHNWTFTLFYCFSELWGDVVLSLLFWGLANDITREEEAMVLYPLFGLGANVAQAVAGRVLKLLSVAPVYAAGMSLAAKQAAGEAAWALQLRLLMVSVFVSGAAIFALHAFIVRASAKWRALAPPPEAVATSPSAAAPPGPKPRMRTRDAFKALSASPQILCLAAMSVAQGLSSNVFQVAWKTQLRQLYPDPSSYCAFMGDVATVSAVATFAAMLAAPSIFRRLGWTGAASVTPYCMIVLGWLFFGLSIAAGAGVGASFGLSHASVLNVLVAGGAAVYVFEKAAKFSLFKPAEEVIYLGSSPEVKTQGKAAVDVCATQLGKAGGSIFQQAIVVAFGSLARAFHILALAHTTCCVIWLAAVGALAHDHGHLLANLRGGSHGAAAPASAVPEPYTDGPACDLEESAQLKQAAGLL